MEKIVAGDTGRTSGVSTSAVAAGLFGLAAFAGNAMAVATLDVTGVTDGLAAALVGILAVAAAMLLVAGGGIAVKWFLGFLFG